jgi:hypothetical protein
MDQENVIIYMYNIYMYNMYNYIYVMEFYSVIRNNDNTWFEGKWMQVEYTMLSEVSQVQKDKDHMFSLMCRSIQKINIYTKQSMITYKIRCRTCV